MSITSHTGNGNGNVAAAIGHNSAAAFEACLKEIAKQGEAVKVAEKAGQKSAESRPNVALIVLRYSKSGALDLETMPECLLDIHCAYRKATGNPVTNRAADSESVQAAKLMPWYALGKQTAFDGEAAGDHIVHLFNAGREASKVKPKKVEGEPTAPPAPKMDTKFDGMSRAAQLINNESRAVPPRFPRLDRNDTSDWKANEIPDAEIMAAMYLKPKAPKSARKRLEAIRDQLESIVEGKMLDANEEPIQDKSREVKQAYETLRDYLAGLQTSEERNALIRNALKLGVTLQDLQNAMTPKARAGKKRSQRS